MYWSKFVIHSYRFFQLLFFYYFFNKYFNSKVIKTEILNTAYGIKSFGLLQLLNNNGYLNKKYLLILDEPEVHLHPEWQIKYADLIVNLVKNGIYVLVNSHSPYMIQAIKHYSKEYGLENKTKGGEEAAA